MTTPIIAEVGDFQDSELVLASRQGNREAFGRIVRRYQGMITGLIYANCGDLHRSEDLAQDTFISAWKSLSGLREPAKLAAWLCQIARHRLFEQSRGAAREQARLAQALKCAAPGSAPSPPQELLSKEQSELLWRALSELSQPYRETLVLYYRQGQSAANVAEAMETTEDAVRQRLMRGRQMLREHVAEMLEQTLVQSSPGPGFSVAVVAALPALVPVTAKAAVAATAAQGSGAFHAAGIVSTLSLWLGPVMGLFGGVFAVRMALRQARTPAQRRLAIRWAIIVGMLVGGAIAVQFILKLLADRSVLNSKAFLLLNVASWLIYAALIVIAGRAMKRQRRALQLAAPAVPLPSAPLPVISRSLATFIAAGVPIASLGWMVGLAMDAHDAPSSAILIAAIAAMSGWGIRHLTGRPMRTIPKFAIRQALLLMVFMTAMLNWRFHQWHSIARGTDPSRLYESIPVWELNLVIAAVYALVFASLAASRGAPPTDDTASGPTSTRPPQ